MDKKSLKYQPPAADHRFLEYGNRTYYYRDLYKFQSGFNRYLLQQKNKIEQVGIVGNLSAPLVFVIAACWNLQIPFIPRSTDQFQSGPEKSDIKGADHIFISPESRISGELITPLADQFIEELMALGSDNYTLKKAADDLWSPESLPTSPPRTQSLLVAMPPSFPHWRNRSDIAITHLQFRNLSDPQI